MAEVMGESGQGPRERGAEPRELRGRGSGQGWETGRCGVSRSLAGAVSEVRTTRR